MSTSTATRPGRSTTRPAQIPAQRSPRPAARPAARPATRPASKASVRLTRRGRVVVTLLLLGLLLGAFVIFSGQSVATGETGAPEPTRTIVVGEGDTLWEIASEVAGDGDIREVVHEIETLNSLPGPTLEVGQEIAVPTGG
jgi:LysM repeat protein